MVQPQYYRNWRRSIYIGSEWPTQPMFSFMCMTRCGEDLTTFVQNHGRSSLKEASKITAAFVSQFLFAPLWVTAPLLVLQINTLSLVHSRRVMHCDTKPNNIVCSPDSKMNAPVGIDWGLAVTTGAPDRCRSGGHKQGFSPPLANPRS